MAITKSTSTNKKSASVIQIFGRDKCFDTKKTQRFFKERSIPFQYINLKEKDISCGELQSILKAVGDVNLLANPKDENYSLFSYLTDDAKFEKLLEKQSLIISPIIRQGKNAIIGANEKNLKIFL